MNNLHDINLKKRLDYLEQTNFFKMTALGLTKELGEFNSSLNRLEKPDIIFEKCQARARQILGFKQIAFLLVDENDSEFTFFKCYPEAEKDLIEREIEILIDDGTFSRALMEKKPVTAYSKDFEHQLLLHVLATVSRVRGMFVGVLEKKSKHIQEASFELFSILMAHCANTMESFELYQQLRKTNETLQESEKQYRLLAETAKEIIFVVDNDKKIVYSNPSAWSISGYSKENIQSLKIDQMIESYEDITAQNQNTCSTMHVTALLAKTGDQIPLEINIAPVSHGGERPDRFLIVGRDISMRRRAEEEKKYLEQKLWQAHKMESIGLLASGIAHDFNNILSVIVNYTSLSITTLDKASAVHPYLEKIQTASKRAVSLARKLYTIGKKDDHEKHMVNIVYSIAETIDLVGSTLGKGIVVKTDFKDKKLLVMAEETRIQQILMNLITNAGHAMGKDSQGRITVSGVKTSDLDDRLLLALGLSPGTYIKLSVADNGPGIDSTILQQVFDPYFSTKKGQDNSGLGLAVVHGIVKNYNGAIDVHTAPGQGTCFDIYLPEASI